MVDVRNARADSHVGDVMPASPGRPLVGAKHRVPRAFDRIAGTYDLLTGANPGYRRHLRMSATRLEAPVEGALLDLCCGTGLSTAALRAAYPRARITGLDASEGMLARAREKRELGAEWLLGDASDPAAAGATGPYDAILMAYGIRNLPAADDALAKLFAILRPGGSVAFHEYSVADSRRAQLVWNAVTLGVIIPGGWITAGTTDIYRYLRESVNTFDGVRAFEARLRRAGFVDVRTAPMDGWQRGIVHTFLARRPQAS